MVKGNQKKLKPSTLAKHKRVIDEWLNNGENGTKAYQKFYPRSTERTAVNNFKKLLTNTDIQLYVNKQKKIKAEAVKQQHEVTFQSQVKDQLKKKEIYQEFVNLAIKDKLTEREKDKFFRLKCVINISGVNKADEILNRMLGFESPILLAETDASGKDKVDYSRLTTEELIERAKAAKQIKDSKE